MKLYDQLRARFGVGLRTMYPERGDHQRLHVSDLAQCPTYVVARILGQPMIPPTPSMLAMWQQGLAMEHTIIAGVREAVRPLEAKVETDALLWIGLSPEGEPIGGRLNTAAYYRGLVVRDDVDDTTLLPEHPFIGHPDAIVTTADGEGLLLETKSERFTWEQRSSGWVAIAPAQPREKYFVQGPSYAFGAGLKSFAFGVGDRVSGGVEWYPRAGEPYDTAEHLAPLVPKMKLLSDLVHAAEVPPPMPPAWGWEALSTPAGVKLVNIECARCPYSGCPKNTNHLRERAMEKAS